LSTKHAHKTKDRGWTQVLRKG